jgi:hypothetical protein
LAKNSARKRAGKDHIWRGSADQTAQACGTISRSTNGAQQLQRLAVEAHQVGDHPVKPRGDEVRALGEQAVGRGAVVLEVADPVADREAHVARLPRDPQVGQEALEARVVAVVEDDEAGIDVDAAAGRVDRDRVGVPAGHRAGLEDRDVVAAMQCVCGGEAGDTRADDGDLASHGRGYPGQLR